MPPSEGSQMMKCHFYMSLEFTHFLLVMLQFEKVMLLQGHEDWIRGLEFATDGMYLCM